MMHAHRQAWAWQDEWVGLTMKDIRKLEEDVALYLSNFMSSSTLTKDKANENKHNEICGEDDGSEEDEGDSQNESEDQFFDCYEQSPPHHKPSLIRWSSELLVGEGEGEENHQILTPKPDPNSSLIVLIFHG